MGETEIAQIGGNEGLHDSGAAAVEEKDFVPGQHVAGPQLGGARRGSFDLRDEPGRGAESRGPRRARFWRGGVKSCAPASPGQSFCSDLARINATFLMRVQNTSPQAA